MTPCSASKVSNNAYVFLLQNARVWHIFKCHHTLGSGRKKGGPTKFGLGRYSFFFWLTGIWEKERRGAFTCKRGEGKSPSWIITPISLHPSLLPPPPFSRIYVPRTVPRELPLFLKKHYFLREKDYVITSRKGGK